MTIFRTTFIVGAVVVLAGMGFGALGLYLALVKYKQNGIPYYKLMPQEWQKFKDRISGRRRDTARPTRNMDVGS